MKIAFHSNQLGVRGTEVALYDYALGNRDILGNESIIISNARADLEAFNKFKSEFSVFLYNDFSEVENIVEEQKIEAVYYIKSGENDGKLVKNAKNLVHAVFQVNQPHGEVYVYVSEWLTNKMSNGQLPYVPHMVNLPNHNINYREVLNLDNKLVVGWYGGDNFELPFAKQAVIDIIKQRSDIVFLFMNCTPFANAPNIHFIENTYNLEEKVAFINTCDYMIHARTRGETFGLAIAEFSSKGKPIITYRDSPERSHITILGEKGIYYSDYSELFSILNNITHTDIDFNCYQEYTPTNVMNKFSKVFLNNNTI